MTYRVFITKRVAKECKKQGKRFKLEITSLFEKLTVNPYPSQSEELTGELNFIRSYHFSYRGTAFRLAYSVDEKEKSITVIQVGPRENFYKTLKQKL